MQRAAVLGHSGAAMNGWAERRTGHRDIPAPPFSAAEGASLRAYERAGPWACWGTAIRSRELVFRKQHKHKPVML